MNYFSLSIGIRGYFWSVFISFNFSKSFPAFQVCHPKPSKPSRESQIVTTLIRVWDRVWLVTERRLPVVWHLVWLNLNPCIIIAEQKASAAASWEIIQLRNQYLQNENLPNNECCQSAQRYINVHASRLNYQLIFDMHWKALFKPC